MRKTLYTALALLLILQTRPGFGQPQQQQQTQIATTVQLPTFGVAIDAAGVLRVETYAAPGRFLIAKRLEAARISLPADVIAPSKLRKLSLNRLERALQRRLADGKSPGDAMRHLAGLQRLQYVFFYPESGEIVIAGPAEGWINDASGRTVGITTGRPVLLLEDLLVALRAYAPGRAAAPFVGCTISPTQEGLSRLTTFQRSIPNTVPQRQRAQVTTAIARGVHESLGMATIQVYGISEKTHFAQVMIEADYRMKQIAIGRERPPVRMTTFIDAVRVPQHLTLQRWWFTPNYDCVKVTDDRLAMELIGQGVQLETQAKLVGRDGRLTDAPGPKPGKAAQLYSAGFTAKYAEIARLAPVYAQLRNQIDMLVAAAFMQQQDYYGRAGWAAATLRDEAALPTEVCPVASNVECAVNVLWKGNRLLCPAGGGVSIAAHLALTPDRLLLDDDGQLNALREIVETDRGEDAWWWD